MSPLFREKKKELLRAVCSLILVSLLKLLSQTIFQQHAGQLWEIQPVVQHVIVLTLNMLFSWSLLADPLHTLM